VPQGDKDKYTDKQKRKAEHIEESYEDRGTPKNKAERRAWATVNKESGAATSLALVAVIPIRMSHQKRVARRAAKHPRTGPPQIAPRQLKRLQQRVRATKKRPDNASPQET